MHLWYYTAHFLRDRSIDLIVAVTDFDDIRFVEPERTTGIRLDRNIFRVRRKAHGVRNSKDRVVRPNWNLRTY